MSTIDDLATGLGRGVKDLSQLNVRTFSGDLNTILGAVPPEDRQTPAQPAGGQAPAQPVDGQDEDTRTGIRDDLNNIDKLLKKGFVEGELKLEAYTVMNIDGDIDQFYSSNISPALKALHETAVDTGKETREGIVSFVKGLIK